MTARVPLTLFTNVNSITVNAVWDDPLNPTDPWNGYPYQWNLSVDVQAQIHSDPTTPTPFSYNGLDVSVGNWLVFTGSGVAVEIVSITNQNDSTLSFIVEDVSLYNLINNPAQNGQGIGTVSPDNLFDCLIISLNPEGIPVFSNLPDYSVPINLVSDITNRFQFRNYIQDYVTVFQAGHAFNINDVIWLSADGVYYASLASDPGAETTVGTVTSVNQPNVGNFTYRPHGRYVKNLPTLPGSPGQLLFVSDSVPGGITSSAPSPVAIPVYIKITDNSAIITNGTGSGGGSTGNISIFGNTIFSTNANGNINLVPNGNGVVNISGNLQVQNIQISTIEIDSLTDGRLVIAGPNGTLIDDPTFTADIEDQSLKIGNVKIASEYITTSNEYVPLILSANVANVQVITSLDLTGNRIINVQDPSQPQDVATKSYVDAIATGLNAKAAVYAATTNELDATFNYAIGYGAFTANVYEPLMIDDQFPQENARILVKNQNDETQNGLYRVVQSGSISQPWILFRTDDFNGQGTAGQISAGDFVFVEIGTTNGSTGWVMTTPNPVTVNISPIHWTQFSSAGVIQAGFGLTKTGTLLDVNVSPIIDTVAGLTTVAGPLGFQTIKINLDPATPLDFSNGALRINSNIAGIGLSYDLIAGNLSVTSSQPQITQFGNITSGTWSANIIATNYGGTGLTIIGDPSQVLGVRDDGSGLEWVNRSRMFEDNATPPFPYVAVGDRYYNTVTGILFTRIIDDNGTHWVEL